MKITNRICNNNQMSNNNNSMNIDDKSKLLKKNQL